MSRNLSLRSLTRRDLLRGLATASALGSSSLISPFLGSTRLQGAENRPSVQLGFSLYGMRSLETVAAIQLCHAIGYRSVELAVMSGWPCDSLALEPEESARIGRALRDADMRLAGLMEHLILLGTPEQHDQNLQRLRRAMALGKQWSPDRPVVVETILGGRPGEWESTRDAMRERLVDWREVAAETGGVVAIKPHVSGTVHLPEQALWLAEQLDSPHLRLAYDYSHYQLRGLDLERTLRQLLPFTAFIHVKDAEGSADRVRFLLPGEGSVDYRRYFEILREVEYAGDVVVEVSGQIHGQADYDARRAAEQSFLALAKPHGEVFGD